ncbi:extracellular calcium-sensing receptor-like [Ascaphus truei]|uniref:extracellular calcium-sensing receptor-like n=1 Tax=Ascaphus truei TaxID=8439 RepID=UPI003F5ADDB1
MNDYLSGAGDVIIGETFPIHVGRSYIENLFTSKPADLICETFVFQYYQTMRAMIFAIEDINSNPDLLPNISLGFQIFDSCVSMRRAVEGTFWLLSGGKGSIPNYRCHRGPPLAGVIGDAASTRSILLAHLLGLYRYPQISYLSTSSLLSDRAQFPSFFRTVPSDVFQSRGLAQLVSYFNWTWVGLLAEDNDYGQEGILATKMEILRSGACIAFIDFILTSRPDRNSPHLSRVIATSNANIIVVFSSDLYFIPVVEELLRRNVTGKSWVASESWSTSALLSKEQYWGILRGTIGFALHSGQIPGLIEFLNAGYLKKTPDDIFMTEIWEQHFVCKWERPGTPLPNGTRLCTGQESLGSTFHNINFLGMTYSIHIAVSALAWALQDVVLHSMKSVRFQAKDDKDVYFDSNGDIPALYDIVNWQMSSSGTIKHVKVGSYDVSAGQGDTFVVNTGAIQWAAGNTQVPLSVCSQSCSPGFRKAALEGKPVCCFQCVSCPQGEISNQTDSIDCLRCPWDQLPSVQKDRCLPKTIEFLSYEESLGAALVATSVTSSMIPLALLGLLSHFRATPIIRANNFSLSCLLLVCLSLCFLCSLAFIGYPQPGKCLLRQVTFGMVFALCVSCVLAKTVIVVIAFNATKPGSSLRKWTGTKVSYIVIGLSVLIQLCLCLTWLSISPPFPEYNIQTQPGIIIVECNEGSPTAFWCMLGYLGLLATISFIVAFLARRLPGNFNEAKFITFSMLAFLSVWVSYIPASLSARGKYTVAMEVFAILSSSWALVVCMFVPKCFIILFRPNMNSRERLMGKDRRGLCIDSKTKEDQTSFPGHRGPRNLPEAEHLSTPRHLDTTDLKGHLLLALRITVSPKLSCTFFPCSSSPCCCELVQIIEYGQRMGYQEVLGSGLKFTYLLHLNKWYQENLEMGTMRRMKTQPVFPS